MRITRRLASPGSWKAVQAPIRYIRQPACVSPWPNRSCLPALPTGAVDRDFIKLRLFKGGARFGFADTALFDQLLEF